jgi:hypothetical protein
MKKVSDFFELTSKTGGVCALLLLVVSFIDLRLYYSQFEINIEEYVNASDIIFAAMNKLLLLITILVIQLIMWLRIFDNIVEENKAKVQNEDVPTLFDKEFIVSRLLKRADFKIFWLILIIGYIIAAILYLKSNTNYFVVSLRDFFVLNFFTAGLILMFSQLTPEIWKGLKTNTEYKKALITSILFFVLLMMSIWIHTLFTANRVKKYGNLVKIELVTNNNLIIKANDTIRYIGHAGSFYFFWDKKSEMALIYPQSEVKLIKRK